LDILTAGQHRAIQASTGWANVLADNEAIVLLGARHAQIRRASYRHYLSLRAA
jgi:hypothetical protein